MRCTKSVMYIYRYIIFKCLLCISRECYVDVKETKTVIVITENAVRAVIHCPHKKINMDEINEFSQRTSDPS